MFGSSSTKDYEQLMLSPVGSDSSPTPEYPLYTAPVSKLGRIRRFFRRIKGWLMLAYIVLSLIAMTILSYHLNVFVREYDPPPRGTVLRPTLESYQEGYGGPATLPTTRLGFDQVFVINLERRTDHMFRMRQLADFMHLNMTVFP
ncbi:hypothetical protein H4R33_006614, partial [Dimargaris cristalligena]